MIVVPLLSIHLEDLTLQDGQQEMAEYLDIEGYPEMLEGMSDSYSLMSDDGVLLACGGVADQGNGRGLVWSLISQRVEGGVMMREIVRIVNVRLDNATQRRLEAIVKDGFQPAHKLMRLLGFKCETENGMVNWFKDGTKAYLYARTK